MAPVGVTMATAVGGRCPGSPPCAARTAACGCGRGKWTRRRGSSPTIVSMWSADGFTLLGRTDRIVKIEGKRVALAEVEQALAASPWSGPPLPWRCLASGP